MNKPGLAKTLPAIDLDAAALEIATAIHTAYRDSYWAQNAVMTRVREELERLDREYQEACDVLTQHIQESGEAYK